MNETQYDELKEEDRKEVMGGFDVVNTELKECPRCLKIIGRYPAISRRDNKTEICSACGTAEGLFDFVMRDITGPARDAEYKRESAWLKRLEE